MYIHIMKFFVIIATVVACAIAAPTVELQHPSPVNPSVLVELKPREKITLITDPKEIAKYKRETKQPFYPTVLPREHVHHITKRDHKPGYYANAPETPKAPTVTKKPQTPNKPSLTKRNRRNAESYQKAEHIKAEESQKPQTLPDFLPIEDVIQETLKPKNKRRDEISKTNNDNKEAHKDKEEDDKKVTTEVYQKPQGLPAIFSPSNKSTQQQKRDIPVPLVPKYHHPEKSPKDTDEKEIHEVKKELNSEDHNVHQTVQAHIPDRVAVVGLEKPQTLPLLLKESPKDTQQQKRDIPVPLVPKHQHPEESPKDINEKKTYDDKKEVNPKNHHRLQTSPAQNHEHVTTVGIQKPQTLPLLVKETTGDKQKHKRDIPVPLIPKHHHSEESLKDSHESESHIDENEHKVHKEESEKESTNEKEHLNTQGILKPQVLPVFNHDHISQSSFEKSQILPNLQDHITKNNNGKTEEDIQVHHISQTLPGHVHKRLATEGLQKPQPGHNQEYAGVTGFHKPQALSAHYYEHFHPEGVQKSQSTPAVFKDSADAIQHDKSNVSGPVVGHHKEELQKESHENIKEVKTSIENHPNKHEVQVEEISESKPYQKPIHHGVSIQGDHKPNIQNENVSTRDLTTSTTDHPALRHRPVPVAELFARANDN